jgi:hypothetical protein
MIPARYLWLLLPLAIVGCGKTDPADAGPLANAESKDGSPASFKAGRGIQLPSETVKAMGIRTAEAEDHELSLQRRVTAQVFQAKPSVLASATMNASEAERLESTHAENAKLIRVDRSVENVSHQVELVLELEEPHSVGEFVRLDLNAPAGSVLTVPRSALLDSARGTFVYVSNGGSFLRTAVKIGASDADRVEITDGLYAGDVVVTAAVEKLWVTELRLAVADTD